MASKDIENLITRTEIRIEELESLTSLALEPDEQKKRIDINKIILAQLQNLIESNGVRRF